MPSIINATTSTGLVSSADNSGSLQLATNNGTTAVTIDTSQNVGIGLTSPTSKLTVRTADGDGVSIQNAAGTAYRWAVNANNSFSCVNTGVAERMIITSAGDVGIGTSSPLVTSANRKVVTLNGTTDAMFNIGINGTYTGFFYSSASNTQIGSATSIPLQFYTGDVERMRLTSGGNLEMASSAGIVQTATNQTIRMPSTGGIGYVGNINSASVFQIAYNSTSAGVQLSSGATSWGTFSDSRLKNITGTYTNALNDIGQIQAVKFTWKADEDNKPQVGVIAQSIQNVVPEAIESSTIEMDGTEEYLTVRYTELIPLMIASIQELNTDLANTKLLLTEVSNKVEAQAVRIAELEGAK